MYQNRVGSVRLSEERTVPHRRGALLGATDTISLHADALLHGSSARE
jgi:hypothetical protein